MSKEGRFEQKEGLPESSILSGQELFDLIYQGDSLPQDNRFLPTDEGGAFKYFRIENLINIHKDRANLFYSVVKIDNKIVAVCELEKSPYEENLYWITGVSVDFVYQGKRYGSMVLEEAFKFAKGKGVALLGSQYSEEGLKKLKPVLHKLADKYEVKFKESEYQ